ncbi:ATP-binding protein [Thermosynechococcaceae cyanobacterium BACA0444]|uniref:ATP-binding protein n=1 Tax=Pseudocalidococcus azoricus BACA0444 TaxID=2918990 RepID=A0AAE4FPT9_9CYAN|nr:ATP-binding protein [Pseudocalidococcus azoricus]MDS3860029.1 ATP-binding protein [Pseudocalidococcus azoricus BACA0444]
MPLQQTLQVASDLGKLDQVLSWFAQARPEWVQKTIWLQLELALAEAFTNAVRHAHHHSPEPPPVLIELQGTATAVELKVWDHGPTFNLQEKLATLPEQISPDQDGGRGLKLLQNIASELEYRRIGSQNCLILRKVLD